jgi:hypothetical protein
VSAINPRRPIPTTSSAKFAWNGAAELGDGERSWSAVTFRLLAVPTIASLDAIALQYKV